MLLGRYPERIWAGHERAGLAPRVLPGDLERIGRPLDFLCLNYYFSFICRSEPDGGLSRQFPDVPRTAMGWPVNPDGLRDMLQNVTQRYGRRPIYVTENGAAYDDTLSPGGRVDDPERLAYLHGHIDAVHQAVAAGADIRGYFVWSLMDNFEWADGFRPRFGLAYTDYPTQRRIVKASGRFYADVAAANALP